MEIADMPLPLTSILSLVAPPAPREERVGVRRKSSAYFKV